MKILSLLKIAEEAGYIAEGERYHAGAIHNPRTFEKNFAALDQQHRGAFAFLAFHPAADPHVVAYIHQGSLGDDAGPHILALFLAGSDVPHAPRELQSSDTLLGVTLSLEEHPAYKLASHFFPGAARPRLPGLLFFDRLLAPADSIYIPLDGTGEVQVKTQCRRAFEAASQSIGKGADSSSSGNSRVDFDRLAGRLIEFDLPYRRAGEKGIRAAAFVVGAWVKQNAGAIVAAIPKLVRFAATAKTGGALP